MHTVTIELLRVGESHGHSLSKKTRYIALCGSQPPLDFSISCDQDTFSRYKQMLSYNSDEKARQDGIHFFENLTKKILDAAELWRFKDKNEDWLHLRLVMTPKELAQLPFEMALTPQGFQGPPKVPFLINPQILTTLTREVRQVASSHYLWPHKPRILYAWAEPAGEVPHDAHLKMLMKNLEHFAGPLKSSEEPVPDLGTLVSELKKASLKSIKETIRNAISGKNPFTHVHILAHGSEQETDGGKVFRMILHDNDDPTKANYADGNELAKAILETDINKILIPSVISLMTCDSSNEGSISLPAGSLAHQLHESGIPCVFASQFKLSEKGSVNLVSTLYEKLLIEGDDPRKALRETRMTLSLLNNKVHDWASLVAYVRFPEDIDEQLAGNRLKILLESMKTANKWAEHVIRHRNKIDSKKTEAVFDDIRNRLEKAIKNLTDLFQTDINAGKNNYTEHYGLLGSAYKRKAQHLFRMADIKKESAESLYEESKAALSSSRAWYFKGYEKQRNHWTAIQYLSLTAIIDGTLDLPETIDIWTITRILAGDDTKESKNPMDQIWAWGTLAELYILFPLTFPSNHPDFENKVKEGKEKAVFYIKKMIEADPHFIDNPDLKPEVIRSAKESTYFQFDRYISWWPVMMPSASSEILKKMVTELLKGVSLLSG